MTFQRPWVRLAADSNLVARYLNRIGVDAVPPLTVEGVERLMRAHMTHVPFENLDVYYQRGVVVDQKRNLHKVLDLGRGGWCFELNGAFAALLVELGLPVRLLGAAVLLAGPNSVVSHLALEVQIDNRPHLVDVGFGDGFATPLPLNVGPEQRLDGRTGTFGFIGSSDGTTLVRFDTDDMPEPQFRFRRVSLTLSDLGPASERLYGNVDGNFRKGPMLTRLLDDGPDRVTLTTDRLRLVEGGRTSDTAIKPDSVAWHDALDHWFDITL